MPKQAYILPAAEISQHRWDACVQQAANGLIYAQTTYLNAMAGHWHGVVINDYAAVMAIPWKMKWGFRYAYMPAFMQQLGLMGDYDAQDLRAVLRTLPDFISYGDIHFNFANTDAIQNGAKARTNFVLDLQQPIETIRAGYRNDLKENIRKAAAMGLQYEQYNRVEEAVALYQSQYGARVAQTKKEAYGHFQQVCMLFQNTGNCFTRSVVDQQNNLLAIGLFLKDNKRIYNLMNTTLAAGRDLEANHFLLDSVISEFAGQPLFFDFEGSELPGIKAFYQQFGGVEQPYFSWHYNGLPWPLRLFKR